ncbi:rod shape-determining protein MreC [Ramlibacter sp. AN1015]|uniref:rod shape-determining protein MreC n=1 Tax=Ramlibacter sp. AN1015 TaxID=3133428 RepID=UPI0030BA709B
MPLGTLDRTPPPFFKQGPSALSKLMVCSALALFLMVADTRFEIAKPVRSAVAGVLYPAQWLAMRPVLAVQAATGYLQDLSSAQAGEAQARARLAELAQRAYQVEQLTLENERLRKLLELRERLSTPSMAAQVLYDAADPYTRKVVVDKGMAHGVQPGSPVTDESGVLGQVTRVHPLVSEVTLVTDRDQATPVLNARSGVRSVVYGDPSGTHGGALELRFMPSDADVQQGDLLTTSGVDGVYPSGLPVARVTKVERRADSAFSRISAQPEALAAGARHIMILQPVAGQMPTRPSDEVAAGRRGAAR